MKPTTKCREYIEGCTGRYRTYRCRLCGIKFRLFLLEALPEKERVCSKCKKQKGGKR